MNDSSNWVRAAAVCLGMGVTTLAVAAPLWILDSDRNVSQVSGISSSTTDFVGHNGDYQGVFRIKIEESRNNPCRMTVTTRHLNSGTEAVETRNFCHRSYADPETIGFTVSNRYIRGVQVCLDSEGQEIKGLRIFGADFNTSTGEVTENGEKEWERANCHTWQPAKYCPAGKIASRIQAHRPSESNEMIQGLALQCRTPVRK